MMKALGKVKFLNSIQVTLALTIGLIVVVIISSMGFLLYDATDKVVEKNTAESTQKLIRQVNYDVEYYLKTVETTIDGLKYSDVVDNYFTDPSVKNRERVIAYLDSLLVNREDIITIALIRPNGKMITNEKDAVVKRNVEFIFEPYYLKAMENKGMYVSSSHVQNIILGQYQWVVSCSSAFYEQETHVAKGVILVDLNFSLIEDMASRIAIGEKGYIFIIDEQGQIVYHPKRELIYSGIQHEHIEAILTSKDNIIKETEDNEEINYLIAFSEFSRWRVVGKVFLEDINSYKEPLKNFFIVMIIIAMFIAVILAVILAAGILKPVKKLLQGMLAFQSGQLDIQVHVESEDELGILTSSFNRMTRRIKALVFENKKAERNKRKAELEALQAQINPHFLYNTLDSIIWMGEAGKSEEVVKMTSSLAKLFRISINKGDEYITVKQELEHVRSYLVIQKMRYGEKLDYKISVDPQVEMYRMIKILLQPIVENAIYHGIKKLPSNGLIQIRVTKEEERIEERIEEYIHIEIEDNGMGMDEDILKKVLRGEIEAGSKGSGVGVYNVNQRIKLCYGDGYGLEIKSVLFEGTTVILKLPIIVGG